VRVKLSKSVRYRTVISLETSFVGAFSHGPFYRSFLKVVFFVFEKKIKFGHFMNVLKLTLGVSKMHQIKAVRKKNPHYRGYICRKGLARLYVSGLYK